MLLGGLRYLKPVIDAAHKQGYYVITADYLPNNIAHKWSDEYCNVSIIDKEAVLKEAQRLQIDGIMSFACDPGVVAASYVQNKMGLPSFGPFESVEILQNKDKFRDFLAANGFNCPWHKGYASKREALRDFSHVASFANASASAKATPDKSAAKEHVELWSEPQASTSSSTPFFGCMRLTKRT